MPTTQEAPTVLRPADLAELRAAVADTAASHPRLLITGAGTAPDWGGVPERPDATLDTSRLTGVTGYNAADMTVAVRAGTPLAHLQAELAPHGQRVAFDPARATATVGGLLTTGDAGPARQAFGTLRDLVIGVTVVLADATVAHSGGHVIKNVAGYDLAKLFHGSLGTLGVVADVVLRLHPLARSTRTLAVPAVVGEAAALAAEIVGAALEPTALEWADGRLLVRLEGAGAGIDDRAAAIARLNGAAEVLDPSAATAAWRRIDAVATGDPGDTVLRSGTLPSDGAWFAGRVAGLAAEHGVDAEPALAIGVGVHTVRLRGGGPGAHHAVLAALRDEVARRGGATTVLRRDGLADDAPAWGPPPAAVAVLRAVKQRFDPDGRLGTGRFAPWF